MGRDVPQIDYLHRPFPTRPSPQSIVPDAVVNERSKYKTRGGNTKILGLQAGATINVKDNGTAAGGETAGWDKEIDIDSYSYGAVIKLTNGTGAERTISDVTVRGKVVHQLQGDEGIIHDAFQDFGKIYENGEQVLEWGNDWIIDTDTAEKIADFKWKQVRAAKHGYVWNIQGTRYDIEPDDWYILQLGGAGLNEFVNASVRVFSVDTERDVSGLGQTRVVFTEVQEAWKKDSTALARFQASGGVYGSPFAEGRLVVGSQYYTGQANVYCDGTADQVEINAMIDYLDENYGSGEIYLTRGTYNLTAKIVGKDHIKIFGESYESTIIEKNHNDVTIEYKTTAGAPFTAAEISGLKFTRNAADTNEKGFVNWENVKEGVIKDCWFASSYLDAITVNDGDSNRIEGCVFDTWRGYCIDLKGAVTDCRIINNKFTGGVQSSAREAVAIWMQQDCDRTVVLHNNISSISGTGVIAAAIVMVLCDDVIVQANTITTISSDTAAYGIFTTAFACLRALVNANTVTAVTCSANTGAAHGLSIYTERGQVVGNAVEAITTTATGGVATGIHVQSKDTGVVGNTVRDCTTASASNARGIEIVLENCNVEANRVVSIENDGIFVGAGGHETSIMGNNVNACDVGIEIDTGATLCVVGGNVAEGNTSNDFVDNGTNTVVG